MSAEELQRFAEAARAKPELLAGYDGIDDADALARRLRQDGYDVTREDLDAARAAAGELTSEQLDAVAGGSDLESERRLYLEWRQGIEKQVSRPGYGFSSPLIAEIFAKMEAAQAG